MSVTGPPRGNPGDGKRKGQGNPCGIAVCAEADFAARKAVHELQHRISARFPCPPDAQWGLASVDVTRTIGSGSIATVDAVAANQTIQALFDGFHRIHGFAQNPDLNHVTGFPVVARVSETRGDDDTVGVFVENKAVHSTPPTLNSATQ